MNCSHENTHSLFFTPDGRTEAVVLNELQVLFFKIETIISGNCTDTTLLVGKHTNLFWKIIKNSSNLSSN